jgi:hypothetical protein
MAFDSPIASYLGAEIRTFKNLPMTCQSVQSVATYLKFDWSRPHKFPELFNYANISPLLDLLFERYRCPDHEPARFGLPEPTARTYLSHLVQPLLPRKRSRQPDAVPAEAQADPILTETLPERLPVMS